MGAQTLNEMIGGSQIFSHKVEDKEGTERKEPGLEQTIAKAGDDAEAMKDMRIARPPSLYVTEGGTPSPFVRTDRFETTWKGYLEADLNQNFIFSLQGRGAPSS